MIKRILTTGLLFFCALVVHSQQRVPATGMKISKSVIFRKGVYKLAAPVDTSGAVLLIEGDNITVDFNNAEWEGSNKKNNPDSFFGVAIRVRNGKNITIRNLKARGYKVALLATNVERLTLINCDFSYNYRPHLNSTQEKEDISDWMNYHHNDNDEWLRYGAAIYLRGCDSFAVKNCKVTGGQNALMITGCNNGTIQHNDFSFNSGIGIAMYRSSGNTILYNRVVFNVRGYSHGVYNRGQDSAGILVYEQSSNNLFYKNNVTHGGDGFFLWAGQTTMDSGEGGCNDNMIRGNDFSYAPTNGIEVTFSRNTIVDNRMYECDHGIWGGYSYRTNISNNKFRNNNTDIAIEHGQENMITYNVSLKSKEAIRLWSRAEQPADWGYAQHRDTRSRDYVIAYNNFSFCDLVFNFTRTTNLKIFNNNYTESKRLYKKDSTVNNIDLQGNGQLERLLSADTTVALPLSASSFDPFKGAGKYAGRKQIRITGWGPYDFLSPIIWNTNPTDTGDRMQFDLLGPAGKWVIKKTRGVDSISAMKGTFPASITAKKIKGERTDISIELQYTGEAVITPFGEKSAAGKPYGFSFTKFFQPLDWEVLFYSLDTTYHNPIKTGSLFSPLEKKAPFKTERVDKLDYAWWGGIKTDDVHKQFITVAAAMADIPAGNYELSVTWDDAVRIFIDDQLVLNEWEPSKYKFDESPHRKIPVNLAKGPHHFRVEHLELGGFATLGVRLLKK